MRAYISNMRNHLKPLVAEAIRSSGRMDIHIDDDPMPVDALSTGYSVRARSSMIGKYFSIYVDAKRDCSDFWEEFRRLREIDPWKTFVNLVEYDDRA
jgi:hypothetical protein